MNWLKQTVKRIYYQSKFKSVVLNKGANIGGINTNFGGCNVIGSNTFFPEA